MYRIPGKDISGTALSLKYTMIEMSKTGGIYSGIDFNKAESESATVSFGQCLRSLGLAQTSLTGSSFFTPMQKAKLKSMAT